jgi:hypothetical protein
MEAPNKIYLHPDIGDKEFMRPWLKKRFNKDSVEYTRTDAFIKRACEWLSKHAKKYYFNKDGHYLGTDELIEDFKLSMELCEQKSTEITMSLDEAIAHCKEKSCGNNACASQHQQLAQWLTELKEYREHKLAEWSENDELNFNQAIYVCHQYGYSGVETWLKSLKQRMKGE